LEDQIDVLLSLDPTVTDFCEQPLRVRVFIDGDWHSSVLDYWIRRHDGRELFREAKYESDLGARARLPRLDLQLRIQEQWSSKEGRDYGVLTDALTRQHVTRIRNGKLVLGFLRAQYPEDRRDDISAEIEMFVDKRARTYGEVMARFEPAPSALVAQALFSLLVVGRLSADLDAKPLNELTLFRRHDGSFDEHPLALQY